jgi:hypothetical protein
MSAGKRFVLAIQPVVLNRYVLALDVAGFVEAFTERGDIAIGGISRPNVDETDDRYRGLLRDRRERPSGSAAECGQQFPPSDRDCHTPLPCEVRKGKNTTPRARLNSLRPAARGASPAL